MQKSQQQMMQIYKREGVHPLSAFKAPLIQMPIFVSFFFSLRQMSSAPLESMKTGGALWFPDLTMHDPYYILPVLASATMLATIELGSEGLAQAQGTKNIFRGMAGVILLVTYQFPSVRFSRTINLD